jgi:hypothetical protein
MENRNMRGIHNTIDASYFTADLTVKWRKKFNSTPFKKQNKIPPQ